MAAWQMLPPTWALPCSSTHGSLTHADQVCHPHFSTVQYSSWLGGAQLATREPWVHGARAATIAPSFSGRVRGRSISPADHFTQRAKPPVVLASSSTYTVHASFFLMPAASSYCAVLARPAHLAPSGYYLEAGVLALALHLAVIVVLCPKRASGGGGISHM
jgi:hypothetical protein